MVIFEEEREALPLKANLFWFIVLVTIWATMGVASDYTGGDDSVLIIPFAFAFVIGLIWLSFLLLVGIGLCIAFLKRKKFIIDDHSFTVKGFLSKKSYEFSVMQNIGVYQNYFCFTYQNTQITIYIYDYKTAYNVAIELEKHLRAGDMTNGII